jgi:uncharacterized protein
MFIHREIKPLLLQYINIFSAIALTGPRQSGKSTLLRNLLPNYTYVSFDNTEIRALFYEDPNGFIKRYPHQVIFDEAQKVPEIFELLKIAIDNDRQSKGKFILSGSSQFIMFKNITESLAGRIGLLELFPFSYKEMPKPLRELSIFQGGYPEPTTQEFMYNSAWYNSYLQTYLERDVRDLINLKDLSDFRRLIALLAARTTTQISLTSLAHDIGVSNNTIKNWLSVLEASYIIFWVPPYYNNLGKRLTKSAKLYFWDTGLVSYLTRITSPELYENGPMAGALFENYLIQEIAKLQKYSLHKGQLYYYRTNHGAEIDLIVDHGNTQDWIEIKKSHTYQPKMTSTLKDLSALARQHQSIQNYLLYQGESFPDATSENSLRIWNYQKYLRSEF